MRLDDDELFHAMHSALEEDATDDRCQEIGSWQVQMMVYVSWSFNLPSGKRLWFVPHMQCLSPRKDADGHEIGDVEEMQPTGPTGPSASIEDKRKTKSLEFYG